MLILDALVEAVVVPNMVLYVMMCPFCVLIYVVGALKLPHKEEKTNGFFFDSLRFLLVFFFEKTAKFFSVFRLLYERPFFFLLRLSDHTK